MWIYGAFNGMTTFDGCGPLYLHVKPQISQGLRQIQNKRHMKNMEQECIWSTQAEN